jgi:hypothetical protein
VVEGAAELVGDDAAVESFTAAINPKYNEQIPVEFFAENALFRVPPTVAYGLTEADFTGTPTKWQF